MIVCNVKVSEVGIQLLDLVLMTFYIVGEYTSVFGLVLACFCLEFIFVLIIQIFICLIVLFYVD